MEKQVSVSKSLTTVKIILHIFYLLSRFPHFILNTSNISTRVTSYDCFEGYEFKARSSANNNSPLATSNSTDVESSCDVDIVASALVEKYPRWWLAVEVGQYKCRGLYDTGASSSVLGPTRISLAASLNRRIRPHVGPGGATAIDGPYVPIIGSVKLR
ncbi:hypothetical protein TSAR_012441 [Trichomalopsis sarcophagae]|uniref:Uncharacterized protein n=1 Tax=Trichomalopsis sarcophagae TaxID=543379 RepID=A0A232EKD3_9HYME|nr:hypothetical protein TSAR_012441 [Trichomalopsis sarcophagae]